MFPKKDYSPIVVVTKCTISRQAARANDCHVSNTITGCTVDTLSKERLSMQNVNIRIRYPLGSQNSLYLLHEYRPTFKKRLKKTKVSKT